MSKHAAALGNRALASFSPQRRPAVPSPKFHPLISQRCYHCARTSRLFPRPSIRSPLPSKLFRRSYADQAPVPAPKKKRAGFFRWTWRFTQLGLIGGSGYLVWSIYTWRNPNDQIQPDPSKKTLVVLGMSPHHCIRYVLLIRSRHRLGLRISPQET